jgi:rhodanese-related sulfurtransferase
MILTPHRVHRATLVAVLGFFICGTVCSQSSSLPPAASAYGDPDLLLQLIRERTEPYYLVDVRAWDEYETGHIPTSICIPLDLIIERPPTPIKSTLIIVYCTTGIRSAEARQDLEDLGYSRVADFGAIGRWKGSYVTGWDPGDCPCYVQ